MCAARERAARRQLEPKVRKMVSFQPLISQHCPGVVPPFIDALRYHLPPGTEPLHESNSLPQRLKPSRLSSTQLNLNRGAAPRFATPATATPTAHAPHPTSRQP